MAPGGDVSRSFVFNDTPYQAGVLSTLRQENEFNYVFYQGTSMAAPHIAGLVSLMAAQNPSITTAEALAKLKASAKPLTDTECDRPSAAECGAGLVDAAKALGASAAPPPSPPMTKPVKTYVVALFDKGGGNFDEAKSKYVEVTVGDQGIPFSITGLEPGQYVVAAFTDLNGDEDVQDTEPIAVMKTPVTVTANTDTPGIKLALVAGSLDGG
jgi:serine protease